MTDPAAGAPSDITFLSDSMGSACPEVLAALAAANAVDRPYDLDRLSTSLDAAFSDLFEAPVTALWVTSGTAANGLAIAAATRPGDGVLCHPVAHIANDEAGGPEFFGYGVKLVAVDGPQGKVAPAALRDHLEGVWRSVHRTQPALVSITNATEWGGVYRPDEVGALGEVTRAHGLMLHMDGARFANAMAAGTCSPAEVTWRAGVDVLSFGFTKNGGLGAEALIFFRDGLADVARLRRKRSGHLPSKGRFLAAQLHALLADGLWLRQGRAANERAARLADGMADRLVAPVEANMVLLHADAAEQRAIVAHGYELHAVAPGVIRVVLSWDVPLARVDRLRGVLLDTFAG